MGSGHCRRRPGGAQRIRRWAAVAAWVLAAIPAVGCAGGPPPLTDAEIAALDPAAPLTEVRLLTINAWSGHSYEAALTLGRLDRDPEDRYRRLVAEIRRLDPDVIAIQEAAPHPAYAFRLAADLDRRVVARLALSGIRIGPFGIPTNLKEGGAILVRRGAPLVDLGGARLAGSGVVTEAFSFHTGEITQVVSARTVLAGRPMHVYAVHLHNAPPAGGAVDAALSRIGSGMSVGEIREARRRAADGIERRRREIARLLEHIDETRPAGAAAVVLGDFNTTVESGEIGPLLVERGWRDSRAVARRVSGEVTWDPRWNPNHRKPSGAGDPWMRLLDEVAATRARIDLILLSPEIPAAAVVANEVVFLPAGGGAASDHYGVLTTLRW
jgi:endonuclease/exonuclease/phosphatase family metal-dependent hydrolase